MTSEYSEDVMESSSSSSEGENSDNDPEFNVDIEISKNLEIDDEESPKKFINLEKKTKNYRCHECKKSFLFPNKLREHMRTHQTDRYSCRQCPDAHFDTFNQLRAHEGKFHSVAHHKCPICPYSNQKRFFVAQHFQRNHVEGIACTIAGCGLKFAKNKLKIHIREAHGGKKVRSTPKRAQLAFEKCPNCDFRPDSMDKERRMEEIVEHVRSAHEPTSTSSKIPCTLNCGAQILSKNLLNHLNSTCPNFRTLTSSEDVVTPTVTLSSGGNSDFEDVVDSEDVETLNSDDEDFGEPSAKKAKLFDEFQCENCGKSCRNMNALRRHIKLNHSATSSASSSVNSEAPKSRVRKEFRCERLLKNTVDSELCGKVFRTEKALLDHHNVHDGLKPYKCLSCDQKFHARDRFAVHLQKYHQTSIKDLNANDQMLGLRTTNSEKSGGNSEGVTSSGVNSEVPTPSGANSGDLTSSGATPEAVTLSGVNSGDQTPSGMTPGNLTSSGVNSEIPSSSEGNSGDLTSSATISEDLTSSEVISEVPPSSEVQAGSEEKPTSSELLTSSDPHSEDSEPTSEEKLTLSELLTSAKQDLEDMETSSGVQILCEGTSEVVTEKLTSSESSSPVLTSSEVSSIALTSSELNSEHSEKN